MTSTLFTTVSEQCTVDPSPLTEFARATGAPCPKCGYSLAGLSADRCPECGAPLTLTITAGPNRSDAVPARFILWWLVAIGTLPIAEFLWAIWDIGYKPVAGMARTLNQTTPNYFSTAWATLKQQGTLAVFVQFWPALIAATAAIWLARLRWARRRGGTVAWTRQFSILLLVIVLGLSVFDSLLAWVL